MRTTIVQSAAIELLQRLTESLEVPFTLTDYEGAVIASTASRPAGQIDPYAIGVARDGKLLEIDEDELRSPETSVISSPAAEHAGLLQAAPGVYVPVRMMDVVAGVLFARGEPAEVRTKALTAAAAAGLTLEFAGGASYSMRNTLTPDLALRAMLRGSHRDARRATLLVKVAGWDLLVPRVALVIMPAANTSRLPETTNGVVRELLNALISNTPTGQLGAGEVVGLPALPQHEVQPSIADVAQEIEKNLAGQGLPVIIGLGETYIDMPILPGLRRSYRDAFFCAESARRMGAAGGVHSLRSIGPLAFLAPGSRGRQRFAEQLIEPLRQAPDILATVRAFLESDLSLGATAERSGLHRHTVRAHLQRAHELTGLDARILADAVQLKLAFMLAPVQTV